MPDTKHSFIPPHIRKAPGGSLGVKLIIVCALVLLMAIPAMFISYISYERSGRADEVTRDVSERYGGEQYVTGPILTAPYALSNSDGEIIESGQYVVFAEQGHADFSDITTTIRKRSLFKVPTFEGEGSLTGSFKGIDTAARQPGQIIDWSKAAIMVGVSDVRGLKRDVTLSLPGGNTQIFEPANFGDSQLARSASAELSDKYQHYSGLPRQSNLVFMSVKLGESVDITQPFTLKTNLSLSGASLLGVTPYAKSTTARMSADWADPGFVGGFAPVEREITEAGFFADWSVPYLARGVQGAGKAHQLGAFTSQDRAMVVKFVSTDNPYQTVNRALKYAVMFIGLVFISYFLFEVIVGVRVHPAQYILIGLAQSIFYLLLLAFAERIGFTGAFLVSAGATVAATSGYAGAVFGHRKYILRAGLVFTLVYGLLYTLMRMQDFALMIGALASFTAIAGTMYLTRNMDWYGIKGTAQPT